MRKLIVLGACSSIAQEVEKIAAHAGKEMLLVARSEERLARLRQDLLVRGASVVLTFAMDFDDLTTHEELLKFAERNFPDFDAVLLAFGSMLNQSESEVSADLTVRQLHTDFISAAALLTRIGNYFAACKQGVIGVITSVAGDRSRRANYVYGTAKAALTFFVAGLRTRLRSAGVAVITFKPGPVATKMTAHLQQGILFSEPQRVAQDIYYALERAPSKVLYSPWYWRYIMAIVRVVPESLLNR
ncbi:MAG TPA: SDR family NAD(P)-dependent oxidoreductase [Candidatus Angelobacter sp.]|nr:SDR family NAD(P)-dependent oxidoreductase [Candidatus Angelobacter sp.]